MNKNDMPQKEICVLGAGNMGTSIAQVIGNNGYKVKIWNYEKDSEPLEQITTTGENKKYLPGVTLSKNIVSEKDLNLAVASAEIVFLVVPSSFVDATVKRLVGVIKPKTIVVDVSKGLDEKSYGLIPDVIAKQLSKCRIGTISGPAIAKDMAEGGFTCMNLAASDKKTAEEVKNVLENKMLKLSLTTDLVGVEVTGSFKNVYAIAMGVCDGLNMPMNTKAALLVVALREIGALVKKMGGKSETVYDLAGLGDLVGTGLCATSRNRRFGEFLAQGNTKDEALQKVGQVVEGINASKILVGLARKFKVETPFAKAVYQMANSSGNARDTMMKFLSSIKLDGGKK